MYTHCKTESHILISLLSAIFKVVKLSSQFRSAVHIIWTKYDRIPRILIYNHLRGENKCWKTINEVPRAHNIDDCAAVSVKNVPPFLPRVELLGTCFTISLYSSWTNLPTHKAREYSLTYYLPTDGGRKNRFLSFQRLSGQDEKEAASSRFWTLFTFISDKDNHLNSATYIVIYEALCFDMAQGRMSGAPNETWTHSCRFASQAC